MRHPRFLLFLLYSAAFGTVASALAGHSGFPLDDSYIYQTLARHLADGGPPPYRPGQPLAGSTSLLWLLLQAALYKVFPSWSPVLLNAGLSWLVLVAIGQMLWTVGAGARRYRWLAAATPALCGNLLWLGLIGMEHLLFLLLSLVCIDIRFK